jgi:hypothetical protein
MQMTAYNYSKHQFNPLPASEKNKIICFDRKHIILISFLLSFFLISVFFSLHGYSFSVWRSYIDGSPPKEILLGEAKTIRMDDWAIEIPLMLAQLSHDPKYPLVNTNIANGMNMMIHSKVPISHIITLFRPTVWGFFIGADHGLSWMWWTMVIGLFYIYFLVFMIISSNDFDISVIGSLFLLFSSFIQFWSFHQAEIPIFMGLIFISFSYLCFSERRIIIVIQGIILGWALSCYALNFVYPPYQISCAYLLAFMMIAIVLDRSNLYNIRANISYRIIGLLISLAIFIFAVATYYSITKDLISIMMNTAYPGRRFFNGGDYKFHILLREFFLIFFYAIRAELEWGNSSICEGGSFLFFFPPIIAAILWQAVSQRRIINKFSIIMMGYFIIILSFLFIGFPPTLSKLSFFYMMMPHRSILGLGIANIIIMVSFLCQKPHLKCRSSFLSVHDFQETSLEVILNKAERGMISFLWFIVLFINGMQFQKYFYQISIYYIFVLCIVIGLFTFYLLNIEKKKITMTLLAAICYISTFWFNPLVSGGTSFIYENELSKKILEINKKENGNTNWAAFGNEIIPNLFRMIGVKSINGIHAYPLFDLWEKVDPNHQYFSEYNRYGFVSFRPSLNAGISFQVREADMCTVYINPTSGVLSQLGVTHILSDNEDIPYFENNKFTQLCMVGKKAIFKVNN